MRILNTHEQDLLCQLKAGVYSLKVLTGALGLTGRAQKELFALAREKRSEFFPDQDVEVRSVLEISNVCQEECSFCSMNVCSKIQRYVMGFDEILDIARHIYSRGRRVLLLQSGENPSQAFVNHVDHCVRAIKKECPDLVLILCLGNLTWKQYRQLKTAGADRYILKFETSNSVLYRRVKPGDSLKKRTQCLRDAIRTGFEVGTGNITGLPGQTLCDLAKDLLFLSAFKLMMGSTTVFIPGEYSRFHAKPEGSLETTLNYMALMRIMYPFLLIPTTSSLEKVQKDGQYLGLLAGANVVTIHDASPANIKKLFPIYSISRFTPNERYIRSIVKRAGLEFSQGKGGRS